jgi:hypothetical protein
LETKAFLSAAKTAHHTSANAASGHRAGIRIGQWDLLVGGSRNLRLKLPEPLHLLSESGDLALEPTCLLPHQPAFLPVGGIKRREAERNAGLHMLDAPLGQGS